MWEQLIKILFSSVSPIVSFIIIKILISRDKKVGIKKVISSIIILTIFSYIFYNPKYTVLTSLILFACSVIVYKYTFNLDIPNSTIVVTIMMIMILISEFILSGVFMFIEVENVRDPLQLLFSSILGGIISVGLVSIPRIRLFLVEFLEKLEKSKINKIIVFLILVFIILCFAIYIIFYHYCLNIEYILAITIGIVFLILVILFIKEQLEYSRLNREYETFIEYVTNLEDWIENDQLNRHEYKNDLAILRTKTEDPEVINFIDEKLVSKMDVDSSLINNLKNIPKGGLKGLIYYKYILAKNKKINITIDVSKKATKQLSAIKGNNFKDLCHLLGIYTDNAIQAAKSSSKKSMSIEIYVMENNLHFIISNSYRENIDLSQWGKKGFTTKGRNHGNGLYFASKIIRRNSKFDYKITIINHFLVQKLILKNDK